MCEREARGAHAHGPGPQCNALRTPSTVAKQRSWQLRPYPLPLPLPLHDSLRLGSQSFLARCAPVAHGSLLLAASRSIGEICSHGGWRLGERGGAKRAEAPRWSGQWGLAPQGPRWRATLIGQHRMEGGGCWLGWGGRGARSRLFAPRK